VIIGLYIYLVAGARVGLETALNFKNSESPWIVFEVRSRPWKVWNSARGN